MEDVTNPQDYRQMADRMRQITADTQRARDQYDKAETVGISPDGSVRATVRAGNLVALDVAPSVMDHDNVYVAGQVLSAVRQAQDESARLLRAQTSPMVNAIDQLRSAFPGQ